MHDWRLFVSYSLCFYALFRNSFTRVTMASGGDCNFPKYQLKFYDFEPLAASDTAESPSNSAISEQFSDASTLRLVTSMKMSHC